MNRSIVASAVALFLFGCTKTEAAPRNVVPTAAVHADAKVVLELGRDICQGCVDGARTKMEGLAGVGELSLNPGGKDFTVHYDSKQVTPDAMVKKLVAAGESGAKIKS